MESGDTTMQAYQEFFTNNPNGVMATVDNGEARSRTFQVLWVEDDRLYFCTGNHKQVYEQMKANTRVPFTDLNAETMESVSICGTAVFVDDLTGKKRALGENPGIKEIYRTPDNPILATHAEHGTIRGFSERFAGKAAYIVGVGCRL